MEAVAVRDTYLENTRVKRQYERLEEEQALNRLVADELEDLGIHGPFLERLRACGTPWAKQTTDCGDCHHRGENLKQDSCDILCGCLRCQRIRQSKKSRELQCLIRLIDSKPTVGCSFQHIVFTKKVRPADTLKQRIVQEAEDMVSLQEAFSKLIRTKLWKGRWHYAYYWSMEVGAGGNVHLHVLRYGSLPEGSSRRFEDALRTKWLALTGDSDMVRVKLYSQQNASESLVYELTGYVTKPTVKTGSEESMESRAKRIARDTAAWLHTAVLRGSTRSVRLSFTGGIFQKDRMAKWLGLETDENGLEVLQKKVLELAHEGIGEGLLKKWFKETTPIRCEKCQSVNVYVRVERLEDVRPLTRDDLSVISCTKSDGWPAKPRAQQEQSEEPSRTAARELIQKLENQQHSERRLKTDGGRSGTHFTRYGAAVSGESSR